MGWAKKAMGSVSAGRRDYRISMKLLKALMNMYFTTTKPDPTSGHNRYSGTLSDWGGCTWGGWRGMKGDYGKGEGRQSTFHFLCRAHSPPSSWAGWYHQENRKEAIRFHTVLNRETSANASWRARPIDSRASRRGPGLDQEFMTEAVDDQGAGSLGWYKRMGMYWS